MSAGVLYRIACEARDRAIALEAESPGHHRVTSDALTAIVFAAAAVEGFLNDLPASLGMFDDPLPQQLSEALSEAEEGNASADLKIGLAHLLLTGRFHDRGQAPFQQFSLLIRLRNAILHLKPRESIAIVADQLKVVPAQILKKIPTALLDKYPNSSWMTRIGTAAMAIWACETADRTVDSLANAAPDDNLKKLLQFHGFKPSRATESTSPSD